MAEDIHVTVTVPAGRATVEAPIPAEVTVQASVVDTSDPGVGGAVDSVNGQTGDVTLDAGDVGADPVGTAAAAVAALGDAAALDVGTTAGTVAAGNDSRLADARTPTGGAGGVLSGTYPNPGFAVDMVEQGELTSALAGYQPLDSDLTAIAALTTTSYGRAFLALADAAAGRTALGLGSLATQSGTFSGTSSGTNTGDQDLSSYATTAAVAAGYQPLDSDLTAIAALTTTSYGRAFLALADAAAGRTALGLGTAALSASGDFQPVDSDLTAIAALSTTTYGRGLLTTADIAALRDALDADDKRPLVFPFSTYQATTGTVTPSGSVLYTLLALSSSAEWTACTFLAGTWRFALNLVTTNAFSTSTIQLSVGGSNLGSAISTYDASATARLVVVDTDKTFSTRTQAAVRWTTNSAAAARCVAWTAWRTA